MKTIKIDACIRCPHVRNVVRENIVMPKSENLYYSGVIKYTVLNKKYCYLNPDLIIRNENKIPKKCPLE